MVRSETLTGGLLQLYVGWLYIKCSSSSKAQHDMCKCIKNNSTQKRIF